MTASKGFSATSFIATIIAILLATIAASLLHRLLPPANLSLVFLLPVLFSGVRYGLRESVFAAFLSTTAYNFFFTEPRFTFNVYHYDDMATLVFFLLVAGVTGNLAVRLNRQIEALQTEVQRNKLLSKNIEETRIVAETERLRAALLSSVSHDLRTPLSSIIGSVTTIQDIGDNLSAEARQELLSNVLAEAQRLNGFIQKLLDMTRLGQGKLEPRRDWVDFRDIAGRALSRLAKDLSLYNVNVIIPSAISTLYMDPVLMEQVLVNILENAVKYSEPGTTISLELEKSDRMAVIKIVDQGIGIPEADRQKVFDMFYRVRAGDRKVAGTGLGLAICKGLVEIHGGSINVAGGPGGQGTTVAFTVPEPASKDAVRPPSPETVNG